MDNNLLSSVLHSLEHLGVLNSDCSSRYFRVILIIVHNTCMNWVNALRSNRSYQNCDCAIFGSNTRSINSVGYSFSVCCPCIIETDNFSFCFILHAFELRLVFYDKYFGFNITRNTSSEANQGKFLWNWSWIVKSQLFLSSDPFGKIRDGLQSDVIKAFLVSHWWYLADDLLKCVWSPNSWSICISDVGQSFIGWAFERRLFNLNL